MVKHDMNNNKDDKELQSRREFFKKAVKGALPILGAIVLANAPVIAHSAEDPPMGCTGTCYGGCKNGCTSCYTTCSGGCKNSCTSCYTTCSGSCKNSCFGTCAMSSK